MPPFGWPFWASPKIADNRPPGGIPAWLLSWAEGPPWDPLDSKRCANPLARRLATALAASTPTHSLPPGVRTALFLGARPEGRRSRVLDKTARLRHCLFRSQPGIGTVQEAGKTELQNLLLDTPLQTPRSSPEIGASRPNGPGGQLRVQSQKMAGLAARHLDRGGNCGILRHFSHSRASMFPAMLKFIYSPAEDRWKVIVSPRCL